MIGVKSTIIADNKKQASISTGLKWESLHFIRL